MKDLPRFVWDRNEFNFDKCVKQLETSVGNEDISVKKKNSTNDVKCIRKQVDHLYSIKAHDDALEFYEITFETYKALDEQNDGKLDTILNNIDNC